MLLVIEALNSWIKLYTILVFTVGCGQSQMEGFIVQGENVKITQSPHTVYLAIECGDSWQCGGSVLNQKIVLSAAHCFNACVTKHFKIDAYLGHENVNKATVLRRVTKLKFHKKFDEETVAADIALVVLHKNLPLSAKIKRVIIPERYPTKHKVAKLAGWGLTDEKARTASAELKGIKQKLRETQYCLRYVDISPGMLCAGGGQLKSYGSEGDSGSALITKSYEQIGVVSFRSEDHPGITVYTNVTYYYKWIVRNSRKLIC